MGVERHRAPRAGSSAECGEACCFLGLPSRSCRASTPLDTQFTLKSWSSPSRGSSATPTTRVRTRPSSFASRRSTICRRWAASRPDQRAALRELLLGEEDRALVEGVIREREHPESMDRGRADRRLLRRGGQPGCILSRGAGRAAGARPRTRRDRRAGRHRLWGHFRPAGLGRPAPVRSPGALSCNCSSSGDDYSAASLFDGLVNYSAQMLLQLRSLVSCPAWDRSRSRR